MDEGWSLRQQGKYQEAINYYQGILQENPHSDSTYYHLGLLYYYLSDFTQAINCLQVAIDLQPNQVSYYYNYAVVLQHRGCLRQAIENYERTINLGNKDLAKFGKMVVNSYVNWGIISFKQELFPQAISLFQAAISLKPNSAILYHNLAQVFVKIDHSQAIAHYQQALQLQPDLVLANYNLGKLLITYRQAKAEKYLQKVLVIDPDAVYVYADLGDYFLQVGQLAKAFFAWQKLVDNHTFINSYLSFSGKWTDHDQLTLAQENVRNFIEKLKNFDGSILAVTECCQYLAHNYWYVGEALRAYGENETAISYYYRAIALQPLVIKFYLSLLECLLLEKRWAGAILIAHLAHKIEPNDPAILDYLHQLCHSHSSNIQLNQLDNLNLNDGKVNNQCAGLNCRSCLNQIYLGFAPIYLGNNLYQVTNSQGSQIAHAVITDQSSAPGKIDQLPIFAWDEQSIANLSNNDQLQPGHDYPLVTHLKAGRAWHIAQTNHWLVCSSLAVINQDNQLVWYLCREYPGKLPNCHHKFSNDQQASEAVNHSHRFRRQSNLSEPVQIKGKVAVVTGLSANVYFHWFVDILPRFFILKDQGYEWQDLDYFLVNSYQAPFQKETLEILGIPPEKILESDRYPDIQAEELIIPKFAGDLGWLTAPSLMALRQTFLPEAMHSSNNTEQLLLKLNKLNVDQLTDLPKRIYLSRQGAKHRNVLNEPEVISILCRYGFIVLSLENLSVLEQIRIFAGAEIIIGPHGSALTNIIFCSPGTKIIELMSDAYIRPYYWTISQHLQLEHYYLLGENFAGYPVRQLIYANPLTEDILVNCEYLKKVLHQLLDEQFRDDKTLSSSNIIPINYQIMNNVIIKKAVTNRNHMEQNIGVESLYEQALALMNEGKFDLAKVTCQKAIELQPDYAPAHKILGNILQSAGEITEAWHHYQWAIALQPNYAEAYANLGTICAQKYEWPEAINYYEKALLINPKLTAVQRNLMKAQARLQTASPGNAIASGTSEPADQLNHHKNNNNLSEEKQTQVSKLSNINPNQTDLTINPNEYADLASNALSSYKLLGNFLKEQGKVQDAWQWYKQAIALSPNDPEIFLNVGDLYYSQKQWQEAIQCYQKSLTLAPNYAAAYRQLAKILVGLGRWDDATNCWYQAYAFSPETATAEEYFILGNTLIQMNHRREAITAYCRAMELNHLLPGLYEQLGVALNHPSMIEYKAKLISSNPHLSSIEASKSLQPKKGWWQNTVATIDRWWQNLSQKKVDVQREKRQEANNYLIFSEPVAQSDNLIDSVNITEVNDQPLYGNESLMNTYWQFTDTNRSLEILKPQPTAYFQPVAKITPLTVNFGQQFTESKINRLSNHQLGALSDNGMMQPATNKLNTIISDNSNSINSANFLSSQLISDNQVDINELDNEVNGKLPVITTVKIPHVKDATKIPQMCLQIAQIYYNQQKYQQVIVECKKALSIDENLLEAYIMLGNAYLALGELAEAEKVYKHSLKLKPDHALVYSNLGSVYAQQNLWSQAIAHWQRAIAIQPDFAGAYRNLGKAWAKVGRLAESIDCWYQAYCYQPDNVTADQYYQLGNSLVQQGQITQAIDCYERAVKINPDLPDLYQALSTLWQQQGQWDKVAVYQNKLRELRGEFTTANIDHEFPLTPSVGNSSVNTVANGVNQANTVVADPNDVLVTNSAPSSPAPPSPSDQWQQRATLAVKKGDLQEAIACYQELSKLNPQSFAVHYSLGQLYTQTKVWSQAIACYERVLKIVQDNQMVKRPVEMWEIYQNLGDAYQENGDLDQAIDAYQRAIDLADN